MIPHECGSITVCVSLCVSCCVLMGEARSCKHRSQLVCRNESYVRELCWDEVPQGGVSLCYCFLCGVVFGVHGTATVEAALESIWWVHRSLSCTGRR